jgi:hypothetical protein
MINDGQGQVQALTEALPTEQAQPSDKPRMPFKTAYVLTREQEDGLVNHAIERMEELENQLGRVVSNYGGEDGKQCQISDPLKWMGKREIFTRRYYNRVDDRPWLHRSPNIYQESNLTASLSQRITGQMVARANSFLYGEPDNDNWFTVTPVGVADDVVADTIKKHAPWKIAQCGIKRVLSQATEFAFVRGESVVKTTHQERFQIYKRTSTILVDANGDPILDAYGDFIVEGDAFVPEMQIVAPPPAPIQPQPEIGSDGSASPTGEIPNQYDAPPGAPDAASQPQQQETGRLMLKRDGETVLPDPPIWEEQQITRKLVTFEGPDVALVYYKDFLAPENAPDIQTCDFICHLYDMTVMRVAQMFRGIYGDGDGALANFDAAVQQLRTMASNSSEPKSGAGQPRQEFHESPGNAGPNNPSSEFAECYLTYDADHDGIEEEILLIVDRRARSPMYYEYTANVTVRGRRPFEVKRAKAVDDRWWGMGSMEYFQPEQEVIDLELNRRNYADGGSGRVTFWSPSCTLEGDSNPNLTLHNGGTYTLKPGFNKDDALSYVLLPHEGKDFMEILNKMEQYMMLKSGTTNGADQRASGLPTARTATGINEVADSGDELFAEFIACLYPCSFAILKSVIDVIYANLNREEVFAYFNGPDAAQAVSILTLSPDDVRDLALHITLVLSRSQQRQVLQNGAQANALVDSFYARPPVLQARTSEFTRQQIKALGVQQADKVIDPMPPSNQPSGKVAESLNYKDAPPDIRRQIEEQAGLQPSTEPESPAAKTNGHTPPKVPSARPAV